MLSISKKANVLSTRFHLVMGKQQIPYNEENRISNLRSCFRGATIIKLVIQYFKEYTIESIFQLKLNW